MSRLEQVCKEPKNFRISFGSFFNPLKWLDLLSNLYLLIDIELLEGTLLVPSNHLCHQSNVSMTERRSECPHSRMCGGHQDQVSVGVHEQLHSFRTSRKCWHFVFKTHEVLLTDSADYALVELVASETHDVTGPPSSR